MHALSSLYHKFRYRRDDVMLAIKIKELKIEIKTLQRINTDRSVSAILSTKYSRLHLAKSLLDCRFNSWVALNYKEKERRATYNKYLRFIFLGTGNEYQIKRDLSNYSFCYKYKNGYFDVKKKRFLI